MMTKEHTIEVVNDLVKINNDRISGYEKAAEEIKETDHDLQEIFLKLADESFEYKKELEETVADLGGEMATGTTVSGKVYRAWMDVKKVFSGNDRKAVLSSCEFGEDAAQKAYDSALDDEELTDAAVRVTIQKQKSALKKAHDQIKYLRDKVPS